MLNCDIHLISLLPTVRQSKMERTNVNLLKAEHQVMRKNDKERKKIRKGTEEKIR